MSKSKFAVKLTSSFLLTYAYMIVCDIYAETTVWIGGKIESVLNESNWDNRLPNDNDLVARFTNSVTFVEENKTQYWHPAGIELASGITVVDNTRNMPNVSYIAEGKRIVDVAEFSTYRNSYIFYGKAELTLVKRGAGTMESGWCGSGNSRYGDVEVQEGVLRMVKTAQLMPLNNLFVRSGGLLDLTGQNVVVTNGPVVTVDAGGVINCNNKLQTWPALVGSGTVTNAEMGVRLTLEHSAKEFSGDLHGKLIVHADVNFASPGSYCVIGAAETLADVDLEIVDVAGFDNPIRFAPGIGTFYVKSFPDRVFVDTDGLPVKLCRSTGQWYVNPIEGNDSNRGNRPDLAKRTLAEVMTNTAVAAGDVVWAAPGVYTNGYMSLTESGISGKSRVIVKEGVTLKSTGGAGVTFIVGEASDESIADALGCGPGAMRCVTLEQGAVISGFTLTNGYTVCSNKKTGSNGGGVYGDGGIVENCTIINCTGVRGGGAANVTCLNCRFLGNHASYIGSAANGCELINCLFNGHNNGSYTALNCQKIRNCTFLRDNVLAVHYSSAKIVCSPSLVANSVFLCQGGATNCFSSCIFSNEGKTSDKWIGEDSIKMAIADMELDEEGRPLSSASALVDAGRLAAYEGDEIYPLDIDGKQRVFNGEIDVGCYEFDWRGVFSQRLRRPVVAASPSVTTNSAGGLRLFGNGAKLSVCYNESGLDSVSSSFKVQVVGEGQLSVYRNNSQAAWAVVDAGVGEKELSFNPSGSMVEFSFEFSGEGYAELSKFSRYAGIVIRVK